MEWLPKGQKGLIMIKTEIHRNITTRPPEKSRGEIIYCSCNMKDITKRTGIMFPSGTPETTPGF